MAITAGLSHPNLVSALHATRMRGVLVLVLEYAQGVDLEEFVAQTGPLPVPLVVGCAATSVAFNTEPASEPDTVTACPGPTLESLGM